MVLIIYIYGLDVYMATKFFFWYDLRDTDQGQMNNNERYLM